MDGKNHEMIDWMLDDGADIHATDHNGWTPLLRVGRYLKAFMVFSLIRLHSIVQSNELSEVSQLDLPSEVSDERDVLIMKTHSNKVVQ